MNRNKNINRCRKSLYKLILSFICLFMLLGLGIQSDSYKTIYGVDDKGNGVYVKVPIINGFTVVDSEFNPKWNVDFVSDVEIWKKYKKNAQNILGEDFTIFLVFNDGPLEAVSQKEKVDSFLGNGEYKNVCDINGLTMARKNIREDESQVSYFGIATISRSDFGILIEFYLRDKASMNLAELDEGVCKWNSALMTMNQKD